MVLTGVVAGTNDFGVGVAAVEAAGDGGISYFCNWRMNASAVGTEPQETSNVFVLARTNWTREGAGGFSTSKNHKSLKQT